MKRRDFLKAVGGLAGTVLASGLWVPSEAKALDVAVYNGTVTKNDVRVRCYDKNATLQTGKEEFYVLTSHDESTHIDFTQPKPSVAFDSTDNNYSVHAWAGKKDLGKALDLEIPRGKFDSRYGFDITVEEGELGVIIKEGWSKPIILADGIVNISSGTNVLGLNYARVVNREENARSSRRIERGSANLCIRPIHSKQEFYFLPQGGISTGNNPDYRE